MNRIVREHYPVSKLPEDLREGFEASERVRVIIDLPADLDASKDEAEGPKPTLADLFARARPTFSTAEAIDRHLGAIRDEWDR